MAAETTNYGLTKPAANESYDITVFNRNADVIDAALAAHEADGVKHVSAEERTAWNAKADGTATSAHIANTNNPHGVTAAQVGAVPTTRKVNGKALSADVTLAAADVGAIPFDDSRADIPEGADLNSYTAVGAYRCKNNATAVSLTNSPTTDAFIMDILPSTGTSRALDGNYAYLIQKIMTNGNRYYARKISTNGDVSTPIYGAWIEFYTTLNKPTPVDIGAARLICGSYTGTDTAGVSNPCSITFEAAPKLIYLLGSKKPNGVFTWYSLKDHSDSSGHYLWGIYMGALTTAYTENTGFLTDSTELGAISYGKKSSDGKTYYWYVDMASLSSSQQAYGPGLQCNVSGTTYYYAALC